MIAMIPQYRVTEAYRDGPIAAVHTDEGITGYRLVHDLRGSEVYDTEYFYAVRSHVIADSIGLDHGTPARAAIEELAVGYERSVTVLSLADAQLAITAVIRWYHSPARRELIAAIAAERDHDARMSIWA